MRNTGRGRRLDEARHDTVDRRMFGRNAKGLVAQAALLDAGTLIGKPNIVDGHAHGNFDYQVEVRPPGQPTHRAIASGLACTGCRPEPGDVIGKRQVLFDPVDPSKIASQED